MNILILSDHHRGSYHIIGELFEASLRFFGKVEHHPTPRSSEERKELSSRFSGSIVFHNTLGEGFVPITDCYNIAMPFHEWSEYPKNWINLLNEFNEVWTTTDHVAELLKRGGTRVSIHKLPPVLNFEPLFLKKSWEIEGKTKFFFVGEPHFRKGHHLLMQGFMKAFPHSHEACLTIKTAPSCQWDSPREDIFLIKEDWPRERLLSEYARHDCFVSASLAEGLGLPLAEAIMNELPICANFWGGHKSLLKEGCFVKIEHEEIMQPFTSNPAFYAEGQKCAFSSPEAVKNAINAFGHFSVDEKQKMAQSAKVHFLQTYGKEVVHQKISERLKEINVNLKE